MTKPQDIILPEDPRAAEYRTETRTGWFSRHGQFFCENEQRARYHGATHLRCSCGATMPRDWTLCDDCRKAVDLDLYAKSERRPWDGKSWLYSCARDRYYESPDHADDDLDEGETLADLRLLICDPQYAQLDDEDFENIIPDDSYGIPDELSAAIDAFNAAMKDVVISWLPGEFALELPVKDAQP